MEVKKIYNLLDTGWIYVKFEDDYFNNAFVLNIPKKYVKKIDNYIFVKKSKSVYGLLEILGMDMTQYDSTIIINMNKVNGKIMIDYESLQIPENLLKISQMILDGQKK